MSQILSWNLEISSSSFPESVVICKSKTILLNYLSATSIIVFDQEIISDHDNLIFLILCKLSFPELVLIFLNGNKYAEFFLLIKSDQLDEQLTKLAKRKFEIENKKQNILIACKLIKDTD